MIFRQNKDGRNAEEIARWDESKKWQKKLEALKAKLVDADVEVSKLSKDNKGKYIVYFQDWLIFKILHTRIYNML